MLAESLLHSQNEFKILSQKYSDLEAKYLIQQHQLEQLKRYVFGSKNERFISNTNPSQTSFDFNIEPNAIVESTQQNVEAHVRTKVTKRPNHKGRSWLPESLPRNIIELAPEENVEGLVCIGTEVKEELNYTPGNVYVNRYERKKYAKSDGEGVIIAPLPLHPIPRCMAGTGLLAQILIDKYADHLPLYRQVQRYTREGVTLAPSTINDWVKDSCNVIEPLYQVLKKQMLQSDYLMVDETPIKVLESAKKGSTHQGYYWVYKSPHDNLVLIDYQKGRDQKGPVKMLANFKGHLQTDGYCVYDLFETNKDITMLGCMAHARRYFDQSKSNDKVRAEFALQEIQLLYQIERKADEQTLPDDVRCEMRQQQSIPILNGLHNWMLENITQVTPQSPIGKAMAYSLARWHRLCAYTQNGKLKIDNNLVENAIRPIAIGRKNYLFAGTHESAQRAAMIYSFISICKLKNVNPFTWLKNTLDNISETKYSQLNHLLP